MSQLKVYDDNQSEWYYVSQGVPGDTGVAGDTGTQGDAGSVGDTGSQGTQGDTGVQGNQGDTGTQGVVGDTGVTGDTGSDGNQGDAGDTGVMGDTGVQGEQGDTGITGDTGTQGDTGTTGDTGAGSDDAGVVFIIDGGGSAISTGVAGDVRVPYAGTISKCTLLADQSGSIVVDIWKDSYANFPPTDADSITSSAVPEISTATKDEDSTLTDWTTSVTKDDILRFNVDSCTTIERCTVILNIDKS